MTSHKSEIITLIDISSFPKDDLLDDMIDQVKEAISFQLSRGAITNRKLMKLGLEPSLARVRWTYTFFDSTSMTQQQPSIVHPMQPLTYEYWDAFGEELNMAVKSYTQAVTNNVSNNTRVKNIIHVVQHLRLHTASLEGNYLELKYQNTRYLCNANAEKFIFVFTSVPKLFSSLVHLATGIFKCKESISRAVNCSSDDVQVCFVDVKYDSIACQDGGGRNFLPCFWNEFYEEESTGKLRPSLKISCLKKIMMICKLIEMRFPWMYEYSAFPFGFGMGLKRLRQWEWRVPQQLPLPERKSHCLPIRKCLSEDYSGCMY